MESAVGSRSAVQSLVARHALGEERDGWFTGEAGMLRCDGAGDAVSSVTVELAHPLTGPGRALAQDVLEVFGAHDGVAIGLADRIARGLPEIVRVPGWPTVNALARVLKHGGDQRAESKLGVSAEAGPGRVRIGIRDDRSEGKPLEPAPGWVRAAASWRPGDDPGVAVAALVTGRIDVNQLDLELGGASDGNPLVATARRQLQDYFRGFNTGADLWQALLLALLRAAPPAA